MQLFATATGAPSPVLSDLNDSILGMYECHFYKYSIPEPSQTLSWGTLSAHNGLTGFDTWVQTEGVQHAHQSSCSLHAACDMFSTYSVA